MCLYFRVSVVEKEIRGTLYMFIHVYVVFKPFHPHAFLHVYLYIYVHVAGSCVTSEDYVIRDILYNGNEIQERATVITRIAPSFIRSGVEALRGRSSDIVNHWVMVTCIVG